MDIELARTFLAIVRCGSFIAAAEQLCVTQTTVTARIKNLESQLQCPLFVRNRAGASLTVHGEQFVRYAHQLLQTWEAARAALPFPEQLRVQVRLAAETSLWNPLLKDWFTQLSQQRSDYAVHASVHDAETLRKKLETGELDAVLMHEPHYWPGLQVEQLLEEKLVQVQSVKMPEPYIYVDWGILFRQQHDAVLPEYAHSALRCNVGPLALHTLLQEGGRGYFRTRVVEPHLAEGQLQRVAHAPEFSWPVYLMYASDQPSAALLEALTVLKNLMQNDSNWRQTQDQLF
ncbi:LysR family transcriptional regulator [Denitrificimonas sp. JX-1]|uniref:LysR family transcriptional regulator n=1 Tax=Denitrificimonas halotolerans TaxID=3098930 RepID=A0ABU5GQW3_9GAMM|nr:LysR family transcriptional regulator [Denitrificimonas sp. JX-1]MDY7219378.1 LysR family transcriptional regulator [Denitrificimonas sp. JX-1]